VVQKLMEGEMGSDATTGNADLTQGGQANGKDG
jgi:hypothetical protein